MDELKLENSKMQYAVCKMYQRMLGMTIDLGVDLPQIEDEVSRLIGKDGLIALRSVYGHHNPDWFQSDMDNFVAAYQSFMKKHTH